jgi:hypothetical protein
MNSRAQRRRQRVAGPRHARHTHIHIYQNSTRSRGVRPSRTNGSAVMAAR